jgi:hypothetical protein
MQGTCSMDKDEQCITYCGLGGLLHPCAGTVDSLVALLIQAAQLLPVEIHHRAGDEFIVLHALQQTNVMLSAQYACRVLSTQHAHLYPAVPVACGKLHIA